MQNNGLKIHIGDKVETPVGVLIVDDLEDSNSRDAYIYLSGCGFTWTGTLSEFRKNKFQVVKGGPECLPMLGGTE